METIDKKFFENLDKEKSLEKLKDILFDFMSIYRLQISIIENYAIQKNDKKLKEMIQSAEKRCNEFEKKYLSN